MTTRVVRGDLVNGVIAACALAGVPIPTDSESATGSMVRANVTIGWNPDLSAQNQATVDSIIKLAVGSTLLSPAERTALEPDFNTLRLYQNAASPTAAQTTAAVKSIIDVLRAFVRD